MGDVQFDFLGMVHNPADFFWSVAGSVSMFVVAISSPILGAYADFHNKKRNFVLLYTLICVIATTMLVLPEPGMIWQSMLLFIIANIGFEGALVFYNGFLPQISNPKNVGRISGTGYALGYVGALASLVIALYFAQQASTQGNIKLMAPSFIWSALFFTLFSMPFFIWLKDVKHSTSLEHTFFDFGIKRFKQTMKGLRKYRQIRRFLLAYFVYIDGVNTVIFFGALFATETLGFTMTEVITFFALVQFAAISGAWFFGRLTDKIGPKKTINITLNIWLFVTIGAFLSNSAATFYFVGVLAGIAMGSSQAASRALMSRFIPKGMEAEFFGFYAFIGKFSAILGPLVFGMVSSYTGNQRIAVLSVSLFFILGYILLQRVDTSFSAQKYEF